VANHLQISYDSAYEIICNRLGFQKVCATLVSKLTMLHKQMCLDICQNHLNPYGNKHGVFFEGIITGDDKWIHHCEPQTEQQNMGRTK
jgi:hypothetical protein